MKRRGREGEEEEKATIKQGGNFLIYLVWAVCGLIGFSGLCFLESSQIIKATFVSLSTCLRLWLD